MFFLLAAILIAPFFAAPMAAAQQCRVDPDGVDDAPNQQDLTEICIAPGPSPFEMTVSFNFDDTAWSGANTGDGCILFDTDHDYAANYALCITVEHDPPATQKAGSPRLFSCDDSEADKCSTLVEIGSPFSQCYVNVGGSAPGGEDVDPFASYPRASNACKGLDCLTEDTYVKCYIEINDFVPGEYCDNGTCNQSGATCSSDFDCVPISEACAIVSQQPQSGAKDCIEAPVTSTTTTSTPVTTTTAPPITTTSISTTTTSQPTTIPTTIPTTVPTTVPTTIPTTTSTTEPPTTVPSTTPTTLPPTTVPTTIPTTVPTTVPTTTPTTEPPTTVPTTVPTTTPTTAPTTVPTTTPTTLPPTTVPTTVPTTTPTTAPTTVPTTTPTTLPPTTVPTTIPTTTINPVTECGIEIAQGRSCPGEAIDDPAYNRPGRRGLAATCNDVIDFTVCSDCEPFDPACLVWSIDPDEAFLSIFQIDDCCWRLAIDDGCGQLDKIASYEVTVTDICNNASDAVVIEIGKVIIDIGDTTVQPNTESAALDVNLINPEHSIRALVTDICECGGGEDNLVCTECVIDPDRALDYTCSATEQPNGCCKLVLYSTDPAALIAQGRGPVAQVIYQAGDAEVGECTCLMPVNVRISDQYNEELCTCPTPGDVCLKTCGDIYPQDCLGGPCADTSCGDGIVDLFDILEAVDIIHNFQVATECQIGNGDVPNGIPPYCGNPPGTPNCGRDGDIDIFDALVIIDKALGRMNCCDYCLFGEIF